MKCSAADNLIFIGKLFGHIGLTRGLLGMWPLSLVYLGCAKHSFRELWNPFFVLEPGLEVLETRLSIYR